MFIKPNLGLLLVGSILRGGQHRPSCYAGAQPGDLMLPSPAPLSSPSGPVPGGAALGTYSDASIGFCDPDPSGPDSCLLPMSVLAYSLKTSPRFHRKQRPQSAHCYLRLPPSASTLVQKKGTNVTDGGQRLQTSLASGQPAGYLGLEL